MAGWLPLIIGFCVGGFCAWLFLRDRYSKRFADLENTTAKSMCAELDAHPDLRSKVVEMMPSWVKWPDWERAKFVNQIMTEVWPYAAKWASRDLPPILEGLIDFYKPAFVDSIKITTFDLGTIPALVTGMKFYHTDDDEVILEMEVKYIGDPTVVLQLAKGPLKIKTGVFNVQFFARVRVILAPLTETAPWFSALSLSFIDLPVMSYDLSGIGELSDAIPGMQQIIDTVVNGILNQVAVWPYRIVVPVLDQGTSVRTKVVGIVQVTLISASDVVDMDLGGGADMVVKMSLVTGKEVEKKAGGFKSKKVKTQGGNATFNQAYTFKIIDVNLQRIHLIAIDEDFGKDEIIGDAEVPILPLTSQPYESHEQIVELKRNGKRNGLLRLGFCYRPVEGSKGYDVSQHNVDQVLTAGELSGRQESIGRGHGGILYARVVRAKINTVKSRDLYCKLEVDGCDNVCTTKCKRGKVVHWDGDEEEVEFDVHGSLQDRSMLVTLMDRDRFTADDLLGTVKFNLNSVMQKGLHKDTWSLKGTKDGEVSLALRWLPY
eukprot:jgi/Mesvir1/29149/Mv18441-RA.1